MTDALTNLIAQEKAKLLILESETAARKKRIAMLESMAASDDMDTFLDGKIAIPMTPKNATVTAKPDIQLPPNLASTKLTDGAAPRKRGQVKEALLAALKSEMQHITTLMAVLKDAGYDLSYDRVRTQMWHFKQVGLVESPKNGYFIQTAKGLEYLNSQKV